MSASRLVPWLTRALCLAAILALAPGALAQTLPRLCRGQTVYVPAYTKVYHSAKGALFAVTTTLVVHNVDLKTPLTITSARFYDAEGKMIKEYAANPVTIAPLGAMDVLVKSPDQSRGLGASFVVTWTSAAPVVPPIVECLFIGTSGQQGISLITRGQVIQEKP